MVVTEKSGVIDVKRRKNGYSVMEVMVSLSITALTIILTLNIFTGSLRSIESSRSRTQKLARIRGIWETQQEEILNKQFAESSYNTEEYTVKISDNLSISGKIVRMNFVESDSFRVFMGD